MDTKIRDRETGRIRAIAASLVLALPACYLATLQGQNNRKAPMFLNRIQDTKNRVAISKDDLRTDCIVRSLDILFVEIEMMPGITFDKDKICFLRKEPIHWPQNFSYGSCKLISISEIKKLSGYSNQPILIVELSDIYEDAETYMLFLAWSTLVNDDDAPGSLGQIYRFTFEKLGGMFNLVSFEFIS